MTGPADKLDAKDLVAESKDSQPEQLQLNPADYQAFIAGAGNNPGVNPGYINQTFGAASNFINSGTFTLQAIQQAAINPREAAALTALGTMAALDGLLGGSAASSDKQDSCAAAQSEAGAVANKTVVTPEDVAKLKALSSQVGSGFSERQWAAQGALASAIGTAEGKLGAADEASKDGSGTNADWAQNFGTPEEYRAYLKRQKQAGPQDSQQT
ncbi:MAG: hypothetical protein HY711_03100 [Candidatus Melainabacteria bacterium]|nr:hypothetical protein [Candidatus Melainabacteria bacterium]